MTFSAAQSRCAALYSDTPGSFKTLYAHGEYATQKETTNVLSVTKEQAVYSVIPWFGQCKDNWRMLGNHRTRQLPAGSNADSDCRAACDKLGKCVAYSYKWKVVSPAAESEAVGFCMLHGAGVHEGCAAGWTCTEGSK